MTGPIEALDRAIVLAELSKTYSARAHAALDCGDTEAAGALVRLSLKAHEWGCAALASYRCDALDDAIRAASTDELGRMMERWRPKESTQEPSQ